ncbi:MAG: hypothetical protein IT289_09915 [Oligoflexia bacterium]|nr:hypothetical protein [Oligoflexia bacterium]
MNKDTDKGQSFFQPLTEAEVSELFETLVKLRTPLVIKESKSPSDSQHLLTVQCLDFEKHTFTTDRPKDFPFKSGSLFTISADQDALKYFWSSELIEVDDRTAIFKRQKFFKLQRRDHFRVSFPENMDYAWCLVGGSKFKLVDLSAGGFAALIPESQISMFELGVPISGSLEFITPERIDITFKVKFRRKVNRSGVTKFQIGCEFAIPSTGFSQKMAGIVNQAHRQMLLRLHG